MTITDYDRAFGLVLLRKRTELGLSCYELAEMAGIPKQYPSRNERAESPVLLQHVYAYAKAFNIAVDGLLFLIHEEMRNLDEMNRRWKALEDRRKKGPLPKAIIEHVFSPVQGDSAWLV